jgi:hypothetical protein
MLTFIDPLYTKSYRTSSFDEVVSSGFGTWKETIILTTKKDVTPAKLP